MINGEIIYYSVAVATIPWIFIGLFYVVIIVIEGIKDALN